MAAAITVAAGALLAVITSTASMRPASADTGSSIVSIAAANLGKTACSANSAGGAGYYTSCTANSGQGEPWCADFAKWVWAQAGVDVTGLTAAAGSFGQYGPVQSTPHVGDAVLFGYDGAGYAQHVAIVTAVNADGTVTAIGGDEPAGTGGALIVYQDRFPSAIGTIYAGQAVSGYVSPHGTGAPSAAPSQPSGGLSGQDPYTSGCASDQIVAGTAPIEDQNGTTVGTLDLMWSANCQTNWGVAHFNDGNPYDGSTVDIKVTGTDSGSTYTQGPVDAEYDGVGQPVWGNMIRSPGCAYATVTRANSDHSIDMTGTAAQDGCPTPGT